MPLVTKDKAAVSKQYSMLRVDANGDRTTYVGPEHTDVHNDKVIITQTAPSPQKVYPGARKSALRLVRTGLSLEGGVNVRRDMSCSITTSHTAGYTKAEVLALVLEAVNFYVDEPQAENIIFKGVRIV